MRFRVLLWSRQYIGQFRIVSKVSLSLTHLSHAQTHITHAHNIRRIYVELRTNSNWAGIKLATFQVMQFVFGNCIDSLGTRSGRAKKCWCQIEILNNMEKAEHLSVSS